MDDRRWRPSTAPRSELTKEGRAGREPSLRGEESPDLPVRPCQHRDELHARPARRPRVCLSVGQRHAPSGVEDLPSDVGGGFPPQFRLPPALARSWASRAIRPRKFPRGWRFQRHEVRHDAADDLRAARGNLVIVAPVRLDEVPSASSQDLRDDGYPDLPSANRPISRLGVCSSGARTSSG